MAITRVWIEEGCIACRVSVDSCPAVFELPDDAHATSVKQGVDYSQYDAEIREAAETCPVDVIRFEED